MDHQKDQVLIERHSIWVRVLHWVNFPVLLIMIWSGLLIYWANPAYPPFFPRGFYEFFGIPYRLAEGLSLHFVFAWIFVLNSLVAWALMSLTRYRRELIPTRRTFKTLIPAILSDLGFRSEMKAEGKFNSAQRLAYFGVFVLALLEIASGFAIYKPVQVRWLTSLLGGYESARLIHFIGMFSFCAFIVVHLIQVARAGWNSFRAMVAGYEVQDR